MPRTAQRYAEPMVDAPVVSASRTSSAAVLPDGSGAIRLTGLWIRPHNPPVLSKVPAARERTESREVAELRALRVSQPELAPAIDLQLQLLEIQRRVLPRISLPALVHAQPPALREDGSSVLRWGQVPLDWNDFRAVLRATTEALERYGHLDRGAARFLTEIARDGNRLPAFVEAWFRSRIEGSQMPAGLTDLQRAHEGEFETALSLAFRPFLGRCADAFGPRLRLEGWQRGTCPLCHGDPELAIVSAPQERLLVCGRCTLRWPFPDQRCPFCENTDPASLRCSTSADRRYRLCTCERCKRYVKEYDERHAERPAIPSVDVIATLPLDAVAYQQGYQG
jgi:formate dehydrogenase maturation protein FdhE